MPYDIALVPGDGIGPEVVDATLPVLDAAAAAALWDAVAEQVADSDAPRTADLGGESGTDAVAADLRERL